MTGEVQSCSVFTMGESLFNLEQQNKSLDSKIVIAFERMAEVIKTLQWEVGKELQLSPIQIQMMIFIEHHQESLCTVSFLAKEFNLTKPTVSDAIRVLYYKDLVDKIPDASDSRSFSLQLSFKGKRLLEKLEAYLSPLLNQVQKLDVDVKEKLWQGMTQMIFGLNKMGVLQVQRMCFSCKYFEKGGTADYCRLLNSTLLSKDIRLDCPEFESKTN
jgi:DNA-binding MarR family transcriptional regulator